MPLGVPIPPSPAASEALLAAFAERGIELAPRAAGHRARPRAQRGARSATATRCPTTCSSACRCTGRPRWSRSRGSPSTAGSRSNPLTLETSFPDVYAVGDVTSVGTPEGRRVRRGPGRRRRRRHHRPGTRRPTPATEYDGHGMCYLEFGHDQVAQGRRHLPQRRRHPSATSKGRRPSSPPTRSSSAPAGSSAGSAASGSTSPRPDVPTRDNPPDTFWGRIGAPGAQIRPRSRWG